MDSQGTAAVTMEDGPSESWQNIDGSATSHRLLQEEDLSQQQQQNNWYVDSQTATDQQQQFEHNVESMFGIGQHEQLLKRGIQ